MRRNTCVHVTVHNCVHLQVDRNMDLIVRAPGSAGPGGIAECHCGQIGRPRGPQGLRGGTGPQGRHGRHTGPAPHVGVCLLSKHTPTPAQKWTRNNGKKPPKAAGFWRLAPTRFSRVCGKAGETLKKNPCGRTPTWPLQHRHPTVAARPSCSTGHVSKGTCTFSIL